MLHESELAKNWRGLCSTVNITQRKHFWPDDEVLGLDSGGATCFDERILDAVENKKKVAKMAAYISKYFFSIEHLREKRVAASV